MSRHLDVVNMSGDHYDKLVDDREDLLEALKAMIEAAQINVESESTAYCGPTMSYFDAMDKAHRAIARAEGKP